MRPGDPAAPAPPPRRWWAPAVRWRLAVLLLVVTVSLALLPASSVPAHSDPTCDGVWVVVDARAAGGSLSTRCAAGDPSTGLAALEGAGFAYAFVPRIPGMVCTIDARPNPCNGAPGDAYWSYWHAGSGGSWTYATTGAGTRNPSPGSAEGWRFGDGSAPPGVAPPANAPEPEPAPPASAAPADDGATSGGSSSDGPSEDRSDAGTAGSSDSAASSGGSSAASSQSQDTTSDPSPSESTTDSADDVSAAEVEAPAPDADDPPAGPSWIPDPVGTSEWSNPPPAAADVPVVDAGPPVASGSPADEQDMALAARRTETPATGLPLGSALGVGLLVGIGALTWRQHRQRTGAHP